MMVLGRLIPGKLTKLLSIRCLATGTDTPHNNTSPNEYSVNYAPRPVAMETLLNDQGNIKNDLTEEDCAWFKPSKRKSKGFE